MRYLRLFLLVVFSFLLGAVFCIEYTRLPIDPSQMAIVQEYIATYCNPPDKTKPEAFERWIGNAEALSRVVTRAGLGQVAQVYYLKCMAGG